MCYLKNHFENIEYLYGNANVRLPNSIFKNLSTEIKSSNGRTNIQQVAFAYAYIVTISFLYKYAHFVDIDNESYVSNSDIKELLGYNRTTKSIDKVIKKDGILDQLNLTKTIRDYPVRFEMHPKDKINNIPIREFFTINDLDESDVSFDKIRSIVKNKNYEVKEPLFMTTENDDSDYGTMYSMERTHRIDIEEFLKFISDDEMDNIDFLMYGFFKAKCKGYPENMKAIAVYKITLELGIDRTTFFKHLELLKQKGYIAVNHKDWKMKSEDYKTMEANQYFWKGIK